MREVVGRRIDVGWWIVAATLLGTALRLYRLDFQSLWVDEAITFIIAQNPALEVVFGEGWYVNMHALYYLIVHFAMYVGEGETILRLPSVVFGILSIPLLYLVGQSWFGTKAGVASGLLLAISPFHLYCSQEARPYAALIFFALLAVYCLQRLMSSHRHLGWRLGFIISTAAAVYCHAVALPFVAFTVVYAILAAPSSDRLTWAVTFGSIALLCAPVIVGFVAEPPMKPPAAGSQDSSGSARPAVLAPVAYAVWSFSTGFSLGPSVRELHRPDPLSIARRHMPLIVPVFLLFSSLMLGGGVRLWRTARRRWMLVSAWLLFPIAFLILAGTVTRYPLNPRYVILSFPPFLLLTGLGLVGLHVRWLRAAAGTMVILVTIAAVRNYYFDPAYQR